MWSGVRWQEARASDAAAGAQLAAVRHELRTVRLDVLGVVAGRNQLQASLDATSQDLSTLQQRIQGAQALQSKEGVDLASLRTCLRGVRRALADVGSGAQSAAADALGGVSAVCLSLQSGSGGPVYPFDFPDPSVLRVGGTYFAYATNSAEGNIQIISSTDLTNWTPVGNALPALPSWALPGGTWAPGVLQVGDHFVLYYSAIYGFTGRYCISAAVSARPQGPFIDQSRRPLVCQVDLGGSIDASPFTEADGTHFLVWRSEGSAGNPPTIWSKQLDAAGTAGVGASTAILWADEPWEGGIVEGPDLVVIAGKDYLFYSANRFNGSLYAIGVSLCQGPSGPCGPPLGSAPLLTGTSTFLGPGGPSVFTDPQGNPWLAFHAWLPGAVGLPHSRLLFLRRLAVSPTGVAVLPPG